MQIYHISQFQVLLQQQNKFSMPASHFSGGCSLFKDSSSSKCILNGQNFQILSVGKGLE